MILTDRDLRPRCLGADLERHFLWNGRGITQLTVEIDPPTPQRVIISDRTGVVEAGAEGHPHFAERDVLWRRLLSWRAKTKLPRTVVTPARDRTGRRARTCREHAGCDRRPRCAGPDLRWRRPWRQRSVA